MRRLKAIMNWVWYPWLIAFAAIFYLYSRNLESVYASDFYEICGVFTVLIGLFLALVWLWVRDIYKAGAITGVTVLAFFTYGHLARDLLQGKYPWLDWLSPIVMPVTLVLVGVIGLLCAYVLSGETLKKMTSSLSLVAAGLMAYNGAAVINNAAEQARMLASFNSVGTVSATPRVPDDASHPDIYYIILDGYPSNAALMAENNIDNSAFTNALEKRGFYVAYDSTSNYPLTLPSLASSLNMRYLGPADQRQDDPVGRETLRLMIANNSVAQELQKRGYTYVFMMSGFDSASAIADISIDFYPDGPRKFTGDSSRLMPQSYRVSFWGIMLETTLVRDLQITPDLLGEHRNRPLEWTDPDRALATFDRVPQIAEMPEATFALIHIIKPHFPIAFKADGSRVTPSEIATRKQQKAAYAGQLEYVNERTLQMIDAILASSKTPPIIIIQGDHGSRTGDPQLHNEPVFYRILNAYYFPNGGSKHLAQDITPVNTFRVMLNVYFGGEYDLLDNRHYAMPKVYGRALDLVETAPEH